MTFIATCITALVVSTFLSSHSVLANSVETTSLPGISLGNPTVTNVHTFALGTWVENIYIQPNGYPLVTLIAPKPQVYQINPTTGQACLLATASNITSLLGIVPGPQSDNYVVVGEDFSDATFEATKGTNGIYNLNLTQFNSANCTGQATIDLTMAVPNATGLNGLEVVNATKGIYVAADFKAGNIYRIDLLTREAQVIVSNNLTAAAPGAPGGANGVKIRDGYLYWTDSSGYFARVPINDNGMPTGNSTLVADVQSDDFIFDNAGNAYFADGLKNQILLLPAGSTQATELVGDVYGNTALRFGTLVDPKSLFVTTSGNDTQYGAGNVTRPGKVVRIDLA